MKLLKRENWWAWLLLFFGSQGTSVFMLGALLDVYDKKYWYSKWYYWVIGTIFFFPLIIMLIVFYIQVLSKIADKLDVGGSKIYLSPYTYLLCLIIPIIGWIILITLILYLEVLILISLKQGKAEKYI
ncbi:MAG: hypothetical protein IJ134_05120 [Bacilli bacterium]|nr:hypothetical protein [Bacilli bacterium]